MNVFVILFYCKVNGRLAVNVALNRPSYSSSAYTNVHATYGPRGGNDGDKSNCDGSVHPNSVMHSAYGLNPWYVVDLGVPLKVAGVNLTNRADQSGC